MILPDVQANSPDVRIGLTRVGVTDVKKMVEINRGRDKRPIILLPTFEIFVDLPNDRKGANLSRNLEAIDEILEELVKNPIYAIEDLCVDISKNLLVRHEYATNAQVTMTGEYMMRKKSPVTNMECQEVYDIYADATANRNGDVRKTIGATVTAMTACPCAQELSRDLAFRKLKSLGVSDDVAIEFLNEMPMPTHNQRGIGCIRIEVNDSVKVPLESVISIIESSMSSQMFELLKREDERYVVMTAHKNPKFVEDCVRTMAKNLVDRFPNLPDDAMVTIKQTNEESIHRHNAFAERMAIFGDLKKEVLSNGVKSVSSKIACKDGKAKTSGNAAV